MAKKYGYWTIFGELFWAAFKATVLFILFLELRLYNFFMSEFSESSSLIDYLISFSMLFFMGLVVSFPMLLFVVGLLGAPICIIIYKMSWDRIESFVILGAVFSFLILNYVSMISGPFGVKEDMRVSFDLMIFIPGALTGLFFHLQMYKRQEKLT
ncbi:MAG: hypothetical protein OEY94_00535 [Alphaproteobacteria bacterium]|nr:hypothetical protein [Alphaproteobacteria bacterium]